MSTVRQVMNGQAIALTPDAIVSDTINVLTKNHLSGAPVVNGSGELVGYISEGSLIDVVFDESVWLAPISRYMTTEVHTVHPDEPLLRPAQFFALYAYRQLPVVEDKKLVGMISRRDLMNHALQTNEIIADPLVSLIPSLVPMS